jgi:hypothetical protein
MRWGQREYEHQARQLADINARPIEEAERSALALLSNASLFRTAPAAARADALPGVPEGVGRLFQRYERVEAVRAPAIRIDRRLVRPSSAHPGLVTIGRGMPYSDVAFELACDPASELVYELHPGEAPATPYTSVYHVILDAAAEMTS